MNPFKKCELCHTLGSDRFRIVFFGTPEFAAYSLRAIVAAGYEVVVVVTAPDKPAGRGKKLRSPAVKEAALELNLPVLQPPNLKDPQFQSQLRQYDADLGIVIAFRMLPEAVWSMPRMGTFNLHASLLPRYRGAAPINHAIINGETETGITTFFLKHEIDTGDLLMQETVSISPDDNAGSLHDKLMVRGAALVLQTLQKVSSGHPETRPQEFSADMPVAPKLNREYCRLEIHETARALHNKVRGLAPVPGAWIASERGIIKILKTRLTEIPSDAKSGLRIDNRKLYLVCSDQYLEVLEIQPEGKPKMSAQEYINGLANQKNI